MWHMEEIQVSCMTLVMNTEHVGDTWKPCVTHEINLSGGRKIKLVEERKEEKRRKGREGGEEERSRGFFLRSPTS